MWKTLNHVSSVCGNWPAWYGTRLSFHRRVAHEFCRLLRSSERLAKTSEILGGTLRLATPSLPAAGPPAQLLRRPLQDQLAFSHYSYASLQHITPKCQARQTPSSSRVHSLNLPTSYASSSTACNKHPRAVGSAQMQSLFSTRSNKLNRPRTLKVSTKRSCSH
jgi:hypothetical protein